MATLTSKYTTIGTSLLAAAQVSGTPINITNYKIGSVAGIDVNDLPTATDVDTEVHSGTLTDITFTALSADQVTVRVTLVESVGDFDIGNIGLFTDNDELIVFGSYDVAVEKTQTVGSTPGNRVVLAFPIKYNAIDNVINLSLITNDYADWPSVDTENDLPDPTGSGFDAYIVKKHSLTGRATTAIRRYDNGVYVWDYQWDEIGDHLMHDPARTTGLTFAYTAGRAYPAGAVTPTVIPAGTIALTPNATQWVYVDLTAPVTPASIKKALSTGSIPANSRTLYEIVTDGSSITSLETEKSWVSPVMDPRRIYNGSTEITIPSNNGNGFVRFAGSTILEFRQSDSLYWKPLKYRPQSLGTANDMFTINGQYAGLRTKSAADNLGSGQVSDSQPIGIYAGSSTHHIGMTAYGRVLQGGNLVRPAQMIVDYPEDRQADYVDTNYPQIASYRDLRTGIRFGGDKSVDLVAEGAAILRASALGNYPAASNYLHALPEGNDTSKRFRLGLNSSYQLTTYNDADIDIWREYNSNNDLVRETRTYDDPSDDHTDVVQARPQYKPSLAGYSDTRDLAFWLRHEPSAISTPYSNPGFQSSPRPETSTYQNYGGCAPNDYIYAPFHFHIGALYTGQVRPGFGTGGTYGGEGQHVIEIWDQVANVMRASVTVGSNGSNIKDSVTRFYTGSGMAIFQSDASGRIRLRIRYRMGAGLRTNYDDDAGDENFLFANARWTISDIKFRMLGA